MRKRTDTMLGATSAIGTTVAPPSGPMIRLIRMTREPVTMKEAARAGSAAVEALKERDRAKSERDAESRRLRREREERDARESAWVRDQLEQDAAAAGDPVEVIEVRATYNGWTATVLQWLPHGICEKVEHTLQHTRPSYTEDHKEPKLRRIATRRFAKLLRNQSEMCERLGRPRMITAEEIDLSRFSIEAPVAAILDTVLGDKAGPMLRAAMADNRPALNWRWMSEFDEARQRTGLDGVELQFGRDSIRGVFQTQDGGLSFRWSKGGLQLFGTGIPDSIVPAMAGRRVGEIIDHPMLDPDMLVTSASLMGRKGEDGIALTVKDAMRAVPEKWR